MALPRLDISGMDFTVTKWNSLIDALETFGVTLIGRGIVSGLVLSISSGLTVAISDGVLNSRSVVSLTGITSFVCAPSVTQYLWIDESGTVTSTSTTTYPGGNVVCLGKVVTGASTITSITEHNREWIGVPLQSAQQIGGYTSIAVASSNITLTEAQYQNRVIEFTGTLGANIEVYVPPTPGCEWTFLDSSTGAFTITIKVLAGTGIALAHTKTCKLWTNGVNVYRTTADV